MQFPHSRLELQQELYSFALLSDREDASAVACPVTECAKLTSLISMEQQNSEAPHRDQITRFDEMQIRTCQEYLDIKNDSTIKKHGVNISKKSCHPKAIVFAINSASSWFG